MQEIKIYKNTPNFEWLFSSDCGTIDVIFYFLVFYGLYVIIYII